MPISLSQLPSAGLVPALAAAEKEQAQKPKLKECETGDTTQLGAEHHPRLQNGLGRPKGHDMIRCGGSLGLGEVGRGGCVTRSGWAGVDLAVHVPTVPRNTRRQQPAAAKLGRAVNIKVLRGSGPVGPAPSNYSSRVGQRR
jgi:hypothetical protein